MLPTDGLDLIRQDSGRFDRRFPIGPVEWPHFDLLWIHEGQVALSIAGAATELAVTAPGGVLLLPATTFEGRASKAHAEASICHFRLPGDWPTGHLLPRPREALTLQTMVALSLRLAGQGAPLARRIRLVAAIIDGFGAPHDGPATNTPVDRAWRQAAERLDRIRGLVDVAAQVGQSESAFRAAHRAQRGTSAGAELISLRLATAERLLVTTALPLADIAQAVGYGHAETFSHAFLRGRGIRPGAWRRAQRPFA